MNFQFHYVLQIYSAFLDKVLQKNGRYAYKLIPVQSNGSACNAARSAPTNRIQLEQIITPDPVIIISPPPAPKKRHDDKQGVASASAGAPGSSTKSRSLQQFYSDDENDMAGPVEETCTDEIHTFTQKPIEKVKVVPVANRFKKANGNALELRRPEKKRDRGGDEVAVVDNNMDVVVDQVMILRVTEQLVTKISCIHTYIHIICNERYKRRAFPKKRLYR